MPVLRLVGARFRGGAACNPIRAALLHMLNQDSSDSNALMASPCPAATYCMAAETCCGFHSHRVLSWRAHPQPCARDGFARGPRADSSRDNHYLLNGLLLRRDGS